MTINRQEMKKIDLTKALGIDISNIAEEEHKDPREKAFILNESNNAAHIPQRFEKCTFEDYQTEITDLVKIFCTEKESDKLLIIEGPTGTGKTTLACSAVHERALKGLASGTYFSMRTFMPTIRTSRSFSAKESELMLYERLSKTPFLVLDEVGTAGNIPEESAFLKTIIAARYDNYVPTLITTNLGTSNLKGLILGVTPDDFPSSSEFQTFIRSYAPGDPIINRIGAIGKVVSLLGESKRGYSW